ncbi:MAG: HAD family hydrolase [Pseudomonadota bacterium]
MPLALFDLDNTLIAGDSDNLWGVFLCEKGLVDVDSFRHQNEQFFEDYKRGKLDIEAYLRFELGVLAGNAVKDLQPLVLEFLETYIKPILLPKAYDLIKQHQKQGDRLLIITATNEFIARPVAELLGVDELLGCGVEIVDGVISGNFTGTLSYQEGKVARLREWLSEQGKPFGTTETTLKAATFYSDSHNDLPLLQSVGHPIVVDGDEELLRTAKERNWRCISLRD